LKTLGIIGAGASGLFLAANIERNPNLKILVFEKTHEALKKVLISGGGRCNVTHQYLQPSKFPTNYPRGEKWMQKHLKQFSPLDTQKWFEQKGVALKTERDGRMFPETNTSSTIANTILSEATKKGAEILYQTEIINIQIIDNQFELTTNHQQKYIVDFLVGASGGPQKKQSLSLWNQLQIKNVDPVPSLFTFKTTDKKVTEFMGLSVPYAKIKIEKTKLEYHGPLLITHWGFSGPAILKLSAFGASYLAENEYHFNVQIQWDQALNENAAKEWLEMNLNIKSKSLLVNKNPNPIPKRLWQFLIEKSEISLDKRICDLSKKDCHRLIENLIHCRFEIRGKTTYKEEFVTAGGIDLSVLNTANFESIEIKNLFFIGEILNIDGITGGFNFQNAWTSAWIVAQEINNRIKTS
jgi:predicted Rossmann fold flavoprotein